MKNWKNKAFWAATAAIISQSSLTAFGEGTSPKDTYQNYLKTLAAAKDVKEIIPFLSKTSVAQIEKTPVQERPMMFQMMKSFRPTNLKIDSETIEGDKAVLKLSSGSASDSPSNGMKETTTGKVDFVREGKDWKIEHESLNSKISSDDAGTPPASAETKTTETKQTEVKQAEGQTPSTN